MKHNKFTTRTELKSLTKSIKCAETECGRLRMLKVCFGYSSMRLGVPFIAPRKLGAVGGILGRLILLLSGGAPDSPVCHRTATVHVRCVISFHSWHNRPFNFGLVGAPDTVRCTPDSPVPPADRWGRPRVAHGFGGRPLR
jgi:hypothetical protein